MRIGPKWSRKHDQLCRPRPGDKVLIQQLITSLIQMMNMMT